MVKNDKIKSAVERRNEVFNVIHLGLNFDVQPYKI